MTANTALIAGGGIAGLGLALALERIGWRAVVLERADVLGDAGAGMQLSANAVRVIDALGLGRAVRECAVPVRCGRVRDGISGRILVDLALSERRWGAPYLHVRRSDLIAVFARAAGDVVVSGAPVAGVGQDEGSAWVDLEDGSRHTADIVIGADGAHSRIRSMLWGSGYLKASGSTARRALVPVEALGRWAPADGEVSVWVGPRMHHVTYRVSGGRQAAMVTVGDQGSDLEGLSLWHGAIGAMCSAGAEVCGTSALVEVAGLECWSRGRVVLVGDACHAMLPHMAQGAAMALEDAWVFSQILASHTGPVSRALASFRDRRICRVSAVSRRSRLCGDLFHVVSRTGRGMAVVAMRAGMPLGFMDWLYRFDVTSPEVVR